MNDYQTNSADTLTISDTLDALDNCLMQGLRLALRHSDKKGCKELNVQMQLLENASAYVTFNRNSYAHGTLRAMAYRLKDSQVLNNPSVSQPLRIAHVFIVCTMAKLAHSN